MRIFFLSEIIFCAVIILCTIQNAAGERYCLGKSDPTGVQYEGSKSTTRSGKHCERWNMTKPHIRNLRPANAADHRNYCRNPMGTKDLPWCYTTTWSSAWEYCNVEICSGYAQKRHNDEHEDSDDAGTFLTKSNPSEFKYSREVAAATAPTDSKCGLQVVPPSFKNQHFRIVDNKLTRKRRLKRVIGGDNAAYGSWPWMVAILKYGRVSCGGTLIRPDWVLTAAHCTDFVLSIYSLHVKAGHQFGFERESQTRMVQQILIHPDYHPVLVEHDVSLVKLKHPFEMTNHVRLACLPMVDYMVPANTYCVSAGWGATNEKHRRRQLKQVVLPVLSYGECRTELGKSMEDKTQMCAGWKATGQDTCKGDSGGPLMCTDTTSGTARWSVQGVISWTYTSCNEQGGIGAYTRISKYIRWITKNVDSRKD